MPMELKWSVERRVSCLYVAATKIAGSPAADAAGAEALSPAAGSLKTAITSAGVDPGPFFDHLIGLAPHSGGMQQLAEVALSKTRGQQSGHGYAAAIAGELAEFAAAFAAHFPEAGDDLPLRLRPLREQWEAYGPGILARVGRQVEAGLLTERADVFAVYPYCGGGGAAHVAYNSVTIEAVLTHPQPEVPEVVRLAWLLSTLNLDVPMFQGQLGSATARQRGAVALIPVVLAAAEHVGVSRCDPPTIALATAAWYGEETTAAPVRTLHQWWQTYSDAPPPWGVAVTALDRMLGVPRN